MLDFRDLVRSADPSSVRAVDKMLGLFHKPGPFAFPPITN